MCEKGLWPIRDDEVKSSQPISLYTVHWSQLIDDSHRHAKALIVFFFFKTGNGFG